MLFKDISLLMSVEPLVGGRDGRRRTDVSLWWSLTVFHEQTVPVLSERGVTVGPGWENLNWVVLRKCHVVVPSTVIVDVEDSLYLP